MTAKVQATYHDGRLVLSEPLPLPDNASVLVTIQTDADTDSERAIWLAVSEQALMQSWANSEDDVFNELLSE